MKKIDIALRFIQDFLAEFFVSGIWIFIIWRLK